MMLFELNQYGWARLFRESRQLIGLALPMMLAQIAAVGVSVVDTIMAGAAGKEDLAAVALGSSVFSTVFITFLGIMTALNPLIAQMHGAGKTHEVGEMGRQGIWFGVLIGVVGMVLLLALIAPLKAYLNLSDNVETQFGDYLFYMALAMPAVMIYRALHAYASSLNRPEPIMWISWAALVLNVPLNYVFVYGKWGVPAMGGAGCGLASALVFWFNAISLGIYIAKNQYFQSFGLTEKFSAINWREQKNIWQIGWAIGLSYFLEASLFAFIVWLIADLGANVVAAQQIVISLTTIVYMIPQAIGSAATVRVGFALGQRQFVRARYVSGVSVLLGLAIAVLMAVVLLLGRYPLVGLYTSDVDVVAIAAQIMVLGAVFQLFDFTQCITSYALRGYKITRIPMIIHGVAFWLMGLLPGYALAHWANMGVYGFWTALVISLGVAALALVYYLARCSAWAMKHRAL